MVPSKLFSGKTGLELKSIMKTVLLFSAFADKIILGSFHEERLNNSIDHIGLDQNW